MIPLYLSIQGTCPSTSDSPTAVAFSAADPLVIAGDARVDEDEIRRAIAYALYGCSGCAEQQLPDADSPCMHVSFVFWVHGAWEVTRTLMRLPNGAVDERHCVLRRVGDVSPPVRAIQGLRRVNDRLVELLQSDVETVQPRPRLRTRRPLAEPRRNVGDAHVATGGDQATLRDCMETLGRESAALRKRHRGGRRRHGGRCPGRRPPRADARSAHCAHRGAARDEGAAHRRARTPADRPRPVRPGVCRAGPDVVARAAPQDAALRGGRAIPHRTGARDCRR